MANAPLRERENTMLKRCLGIGLACAAVASLGAWLVRRYPVELTSQPWDIVFQYGLLATILAAVFMIPIASMMLLFRWWTNRGRR